MMILALLNGYQFISRGRDRERYIVEKEGAREIDKYRGRGMEVGRWIGGGEADRGRDIESDRNGVEREREKRRERAREKKREREKERKRERMTT